MLVKDISGREDCKCKAKKVGKWEKGNDWNYNRIENSENKLMVYTVPGNS